jgi:hypothetical protein
MVECRFLVQGNLECSRVELEAKRALKIPGGRLDEMAKTENKKQPKRQFGFGFGFGFGFWNPNIDQPSGFVAHASVAAVQTKLT